MARKVKKAVRALGVAKPQNLAAPATFTPPPYRWVLGAVLGIETLLLFWALGHHFIPSASWRSIAFYINIVICVFCVAYFVYAFWLNTQLYGSKIKTCFVLITAPLLFYFWGYFALTYGAGDLITQLQGKPAMMEDVFAKNTDDEERFKKEYIANGVYEKRYFDNRKGCITRLTSDTLKNALPVYFCAKGEEFAKLPMHVAVKINGLQAYSGFDLQSIEYDWLKTSFLPIEN
jgi:hypothetical protein